MVLSKLQSRELMHQYIAKFFSLKIAKITIIFRKLTTFGEFDFSKLFEEIVGSVYKSDLFIFAILAYSMANFEAILALFFNNSTSKIYIKFSLI